MPRAITSGLSLMPPAVAGVLAPVAPLPTLGAAVVEVDFLSLPHAARARVATVPMASAARHERTRNPAMLSPWSSCTLPVH